MTLKMWFDILINPWTVSGYALVALVGCVAIGWWGSRLLARRLGRLAAWRSLVLTATRLAGLVVGMVAAGLLLDSQSQTAEIVDGVWKLTISLVTLEPVVVALQIVLVAVLGWVALRLAKWGRNKLSALAAAIESRGDHITGIRFQRAVLFSPSQALRALVFLTRLAKYAASALLVIVYGTVVLSIFPPTRAWVSAFLDGVLQILGSGWKAFESYLPNLLVLIVIIAVAFYGLKAIRFVFREIQKGTLSFPQFHQDWALPTYQLVRFFIIVLAFVGAFPFLPGSSSPAFQGISVFLGLLISLGSTSFISNIVSGIVLTYTRAFKVGDRVKIGDTVGDVVEKRLLVTRVRTIKNVEVTVPNGLVMTNHILNYSTMAAESGLIVHTTVSLGYDIPWRKVHETLIAAALATAELKADPPPFVLQTSLDDFYVSYQLNAATDQPSHLAVITSELHQNIQDFCARAGIEILSPHYGALRDGNESTVPETPQSKDSPPRPFGAHPSRPDPLKNE